MNFEILKQTETFGALINDFVNLLDDDDGLAIGVKHNGDGKCQR